MKRGRASKYVPAFCAAMLFCDSYKILTTRIPQNRTTVTKTKTAQKQTASIHGRQYGKANGRGNHSNQAGSFNDDLIPNSHHSRAAVYKPKTKKVGLQESRDLKHYSLSCIVLSIQITKFSRTIWWSTFLYTTYMYFSELITLLGFRCV